MACPFPPSVLRRGGTETPKAEGYTLDGSSVEVDGVGRVAGYGIYAHPDVSIVCTSRAQENCTGLGMAVLMYHQGRVYRRLYGRVRRGPLRWMRDPTLILTLTLYPGPHAAARLDPPLNPRGSVSKSKGKGRCSQGVSRSVGGWAGKDRKTA